MSIPPRREVAPECNYDEEEGEAESEEDPLQTELFNVTMQAARDRQQQQQGLDGTNSGLACTG
jgi:hypothetical protein